MKDRSIKTIQNTPVTEHVSRLWGEIDYLHQEGLNNQELAQIQAEVEELVDFIKFCQESNDLLYT